MTTLVCKNAPDFNAVAVMKDGSINEKFNLYSYIKDSYAIIFFYPLDFTFVCPSEILEFNRQISMFEQKNCKVIGISVDSHFSHLAWRNTEIKKGGIGNIDFPLIADLNKDIALSYGVLLDRKIALRGLFLIDIKQVVRHAVVNDLPLGRNVNEALRMVDALIFHDQNGEVCPANWNKDKKGMQATTQGVAEYLSQEFKD